MQDYIFERKIVKTRKNHQCFGCGDNIPKGKKVLYEEALIDDNWCSNRVCLTYIELGKAFCIAEYFKEFQEYLPKDYVYEYFSDQGLFVFDFIFHAYYKKPLEFNHLELRNA